MAEERKLETGTTRTDSPVGGERINVERTDYYTDRDATVHNRGAAAIKRVSWGAIFAGAVITLVTQLALSILGIGIGASTVNPLNEQNSTSGLGAGAGI